MLSLLHLQTQRLSAAGPQREHKQRHTRSATVELKPVHLESKPSGGPRHRHAASVDASGFDKTEAKSTEARMVDSPSSAGSPASPTSSTPPTPSSPSSALDDVVITQELSRFLIPHIEAYTATRARIRQYEEQLAEQMAIVASLDSKLNSIATRGTGSAQDAAVLKQDKDRAEVRTNALCLMRSHHRWCRAVCVGKFEVCEKRFGTRSRQHQSLESASCPGLVPH